MIAVWGLMGGRTGLNHLEVLTVSYGGLASKALGIDEV